MTRPEVSAPHLLAILPRGEAIRNFVYTGALQTAGRAIDVSVVSVVPNERIERTLREEFESYHRLDTRLERPTVRRVRELLDMAHGRWLWSRAARQRWSRKNRMPRTWGGHAKQRAKTAIARPLANRAAVRWLSRVERGLSRRLRQDEEVVTLLRRLRPTLVFNGSHVHSAVAVTVVQAARWEGIPTAAFLFSWDNLTSQGRIIPPYDHYLAWNDRMREDLLAIYDDVDPDQISVTGTPQFDFHFRPEYRWSREEFCQRVGADPDRPIVLYTTGMANHVAGEPEVVEGIADMLEAWPELGPPQLLVRVYPKGPQDVFDGVKARRPEILFPPIPWESSWLTPEREDLYLYVNTLRHAAVGINVASTVSLELCMWDRPVINVCYLLPGVDYEFDPRSYYEFEHYRPLVQSGAIGLARSPDEMRRMLRRALIEPGADAERRRELLERMFGGTLDGRSSDRVADRLVELAGGTSAAPRRRPASAAGSFQPPA